MNKIILKHILPTLIAFPLSYGIILILSYLFPKIFIEIPHEATNIFSIIISQLNNSLAILLALTFTIKPYISTLFKAQSIKDINIKRVIETGLSYYLAIIIFSIVGIVRKVI